MQVSVLVQMLREKIEPKLIYSPFLRLIIFSVWFQLGFAAVMLTLIGAVLYLPKIWRVSPSGFEPIVHISGLDMTQNWALKRTARRFDASGDFKKAADAWQGAVGQNPADPAALRGFFETCIHLPPQDRKFNAIAISQMQWLLRIHATNISDLELVARVCDRFAWYDVGNYFLGHASVISGVSGAPLPGVAEAVMIKSLFHLGRLPEFADRLQKTPNLKDPELDLYRLAYTAGWSDLDSANAFERLENVVTSESGANSERAGHLLLKASAQKNKTEIYSRELDRLASHNAANAADYAIYWNLLANNGRTPEAVKLAQTSSVVPDSAPELIRLVQTYLSLHLLDNAADLLKRVAPEFGRAPEVWGVYGSVLEARQDWDQMRQIGRTIRQDAGLRSSVWGLGYYLEGRADLAQKRDASAQAAFQRAADSDYDYENAGLVVSRELLRLNYPKPAIQILQKIETRFEKNVPFWIELFNAAYAVQDIDLLLQSAQRGYQLLPADPLAMNRYAAALLLKRLRPDEAIQLTLQLYSRYPQSATTAINHSCALLLNNRASEAKNILERLDPASLSTLEISPYYLSLFEAYHDLKLWDQAWKARAKIADSTLFPSQRDWLQAKEKEMPRRLAQNL